MTLPYSRFPLGRALSGIKSAGYRYVAWGTQHLESDGQQVPVLAGMRPPTGLPSWAGVAATWAWSRC
jgi:hypothetical protein